MNDLIQNPLQPQVNSIVPPTMDGVVNNPLSAIQTTQPQTPQEVQSRKSQWAQVLEDPNMKGALLRMGLQMIQGSRQNESSAGTVARAGMNALDYYGAKTALDAKNKTEAEKAALDARNVNSQIEGRDATTAGTRVETETNQSKLNEWNTQSDMRKKTAQTTYDNLVTSGKLDEAKLLKSSFEAEQLKSQADFLRANPTLASKINYATLTEPIQKMNKNDSSIGVDEAQMRSLANDDEVARGNLDVNRSQVGLQKRELEAKIDGTLQTGSSTDKSADYDGAADLVLAEYARADKKKYPTVEKFVSENYNVTLGKSVAGVMKSIKAKQAAGSPTGGTPPSGAGWSIKPIN